MFLMAKLQIHEARINKIEEKKKTIQVEDFYTVLSVLIDLSRQSQFKHIGSKE